MAKPIKERFKAMFTKQAEKSLTDRIDQISAALRAAFKKTGASDGEYRYRFYWPKEVFDNYVVSSEDETSKLFKIPYTIAATP